MFAASWTITRGVDVANPPEKLRLHLRISGVVFLLQIGDHVESVWSGQVGVDDAMTQAGLGLFLFEHRVGVDNPIHRAIANGMGADRNPVLVEEADHLPV